MEKIGVVGTGIMGSGIAKTFLSKGYSVHVYNRSQEKPKILGEIGAIIESTPKNVADACDVVFILVWNKTALDAITLGPEGLVAGAHKGEIFVDMSTQLPETAEWEASLYHSKGADFLDAPVHGSKDEANSGGLWMMVGGARDVYERILPILKVISASQHYMGGWGKGFATKLCGNLLVSTIVAALSEALVLAQKAGIDPEEALKLWQESDFRSPVVGGVGRSICTRNFEVSFHLRTMVKDTDLIHQYAEQIGVPLMLANSVHELNKIGLNKGFGDENASAVVKVYEDMAGIIVKGTAAQKLI